MTALTLEVEDGLSISSLNCEKEIAQLYFMSIVLKLNEIHGKKKKRLGTILKMS